MNRKDILDAALKCVNGDRDRQYGSPEHSFPLIAKFWTAYLNLGGPEGDAPNSIEGKDVAAMLALMKIARIASNNPKADNWIDLAGYAACGGELETGGTDYTKDELYQKLTSAYAPIAPSACCCDDLSRFARAFSTNDQSLENQNK